MSRKSGGFWAWASEHWILSGFVLLPTAILMPVYLAGALRQPSGPQPSGPPRPLPSTGAATLTLRSGRVVRVGDFVFIHPREFFGSFPVMGRDETTPVRVTVSALDTPNLGIPSILAKGSDDRIASGFDQIIPIASIVG